MSMKCLTSNRRQSCGDSRYTLGPWAQGVLGPQLSATACSFSPLLASPNSLGRAQTPSTQCYSMLFSSWSTQRSNDLKKSLAGGLGAALLV